MQLKLTWRSKDHRDMDLMVSSDQKIAETMEVLSEKGLIEEAEDSIRYVRSLRTNDQINTLLTYHEADIFSGDILVLEDAQDQE